MKRYFFLIITFCIIFSCDPASASALNKAVFIVNSQSYSVNGSVYQMDVLPSVEKDRVLLPLRYLAYSLGFDEKDITWDAQSKSAELRSVNLKIKLIPGVSMLYVNSKSYPMDVAPVLKDDRIFLPARWVAEASGYSVGWDEKARAVLIGPPGDLPDAKALLETVAPLKVRPCEFPASDLSLDQKISSSSIVFHGDYANVYNAGVAASYVDGFVLEPGKNFSFNEVVGDRTTQKGFIIGYDIMNELTVGGGVCRTSTVLFQVAKEAGLDILERHPHYYPVHYTPPGTDASVSWGWMDLKFKNNLDRPLVIHSGLEEQESGRRLWAELWLRTPLTRLDIAVSKKEPGPNRWENVERARLTALVKDDVSFVSLEQLSDFYRLSLETREQDGLVAAQVDFNGQLVSFCEGSKKASLNGVEFDLLEAPFTLSDCSCKFWIPLRDWAKLAGADVQWKDGSPPLILLNSSGAPLTGKRN